MFNSFLISPKKFNINSVRDSGYAGAYYNPADARLPLHSSNAVYELKDILGQDIHLAQGTDSKRPTTNIRSIKGVNVLDLVAASLQDLFDTTNAVATTLSGINKPFALYVVFQKDLTGLSHVLVEIDSSVSANRYIALRVNTSERLNLAMGDDSLAVSNLSTTAVIDTNPHILSVRYDSANVKFYVNGWLDSTQAVSLGTKTLDGVRMGSYRGATQFTDGGIGDSLILTSNPTDDIDNKIIGYIAWKYSLFNQLDYNQPYRFDGTLFGYKTVWKPTSAEIANLVHIDPNSAANTTRSAGAVSQLTTVQGSLTLAQATGSKQPSITARTINGIRALDFIAANSQRLFDVTNAIATALSGTSLPFAMYAVVQRDLGSATQRIFVLSSSSSANPQTILFINATNQIEVARRDDSLNVKSITNIIATIDTNPHVISCRFNGTTIYIYLNGALVYSADGSAGVGAITLDQAEIGSFRDTSTQYFDGAMSDVLAIPSNPTDAVDSKINGYLAWKHFLENQLDYAHTYRFDGTLFGRYRLWKPTTTDIASLVHIEPNAVANVTSSAGAVSQLTTVQGTLALAQATGSKQPSIIARTINGVKSLDFISANLQFLSDVNNAIATALSGSDKAFSFYAVAQRDLTQVNRLISLGHSSLANPLLSFMTNSTTNHLQILKRDDAGVLVTVNSSVAIDTNPHILSCRFDGTNARLYIDGVLVVTADMSSTLGDTTFDTLLIGTFNGGSCWDGAIGSCFAMAENPSDAMHEKLEGFLAHQYKLTANLPSTHSYKHNPPME